MGLTHYWKRPTELSAKTFEAAVKEVRRVLDEAGVPLAGFEGRGSPLLETHTIVFNGANGASCEPFEIHQVEFDRRGRSEVTSFCKTQGLPYDLAVKATLIVLKTHFGLQLKVMSDENDQHWDAARALVSRSITLSSRFELDVGE